MMEAFVSKQKRTSMRECPGLLLLLLLLLLWDCVSRLWGQYPIA
jgi:hypothetical protein